MKKVCIILIYNIIKSQLNLLVFKVWLLKSYFSKMCPFFIRHLDNIARRNDQLGKWSIRTNIQNCTLVFMLNGLHRRSQISKKANEIRDITYLQKFHSFANAVRQQDNAYINELKGVF